MQCVLCGSTEHMAYACQWTPGAWFNLHANAGPKHGDNQWDRLIATAPLPHYPEPDKPE